MSKSRQTGDIISGLDAIPAGNLVSVDASGNPVDGGAVPVATNPNLLINGDFSVWQRGTSFTAGELYTADRWVYLYGGSAVSVSKNTDSSGNNALLLTGVAGNAGSTIDQRLEQSTSKVFTTGGAATLSAAIYSDVVATVNLTITTPNAVDDWSGSTVLDTTTVNLGVGYTIVNHTFNLAAGSVANGMGVRFEFGTLTSGQRSLTKVKLEQGSVATPFPYRSIGDELALCQRYYQRFPEGDSSTILSTGYVSNGAGTQALFSIKLHGRMRVSPSFNSSPPGQFNVSIPSGGTNPTNVTVASNSATIVSLLCTIAAQTPSAGCGLQVTSNTTFIAFDAEL